jgi:hypothetical protein
MSTEQFHRIQTEPAILVIEIPSLSRHVADMIRQHRNHPCVFLWGLSPDNIQRIPPPYPGSDFFEGLCGVFVAEQT